MKTPHLWFEPINFPERLMGSYDHDNSPDFLSFIQGKRIAATTPPPFIKFTAPRRRLAPFGVLPNSIDIPLLSPRAASMLNEFCPNDIQLIPAKIETSEGPLDDYFLLNVLSMISGIDHAHSVVKVIPGTNHIVNVNRLRYSPGAMLDHHLAREHECHTYLWVSDELAQRFAQEKIKGCVFEPPEAIHP